ESEEHVRQGDPQPGLLDRAEAAEPLPDLIARLTDALGEHAVASPAPVDTWRPEAAWRAVPFGAGRAFGPPPPVKPDPVDLLGDRERELPRPRPALLLERPQSLQVRVVQGRPAALN